MIVFFLTSSSRDKGEWVLASHQQTGFCCMVCFFYRQVNYSDDSFSFTSNINLGYSGS